MELRKGYLLYALVSRTDLPFTPESLTFLPQQLICVTIQFQQCCGPMNTKLVSRAIYLPQSKVFLYLVKQSLHKQFTSFQNKLLIKLNNLGVSLRVVDRYLYSAIFRDSCKS